MDIAEEAENAFVVHVLGSANGGIEPSEALELQRVGMGVFVVGWPMRLFIASVRLWVRVLGTMPRKMLSVMLSVVPSRSCSVIWRSPALHMLGQLYRICLYGWVFGSRPSVRSVAWMISRSSAWLVTIALRFGRTPLSFLGLGLASAVVSALPMAVAMSCFASMGLGAFCRRYLNFRRVASIAL